LIAGYGAPHAAVKLCAAGLGISEWASADRGGEPDVVRPRDDLLRYSC
jgi:phosphoketolase